MQQQQIWQRVLVAADQVQSVGALEDKGQRTAHVQLLYDAAIMTQLQQVLAPKASQATIGTLVHDMKVGGSFYAVKRMSSCIVPTFQHRQQTWKVQLVVIPGWQAW
jgi:hypothetical protein